MQTKTCTHCGENKPVSAFHLYPNGRPKSWCKSCLAIYIATKRAARPKTLKRNPNGVRKPKKPGKPPTPEQRRIGRLRDKFGITVGEYDRLFAWQGGVCAICSKPETKVIRGKVVMLAVDHDHATGRVRGLLCHSCNIALGMLRDSPDLLQRAINYLHYYLDPDPR